MEIIIFYIKSHYRFISWILLLILTAILLLFPIHLQFEYDAVESLNIFGDNLLIFMVLYTTWLALILLMLFAHINEFQRIALISIFVLVYLGFWVIITPYGSYADGLVNMGHVRYLAQIGTIPFNHPMLTYFQFPGFHLSALSFLDISGLDIFITRIVLMIIYRILLFLLLYIFFKKSLKNPTLASLSVLLILFGNLMFSRTEFHAQATALIFFIILVLRLFVEHTDRVTTFTLLVLTCFPAITITYLPLQVYFIFTLCGIYVLQKFNGKKIINWKIIIFCILIFIIWEAYGATRFLNNIPTYIKNFLSGLSEPLIRLRPILGIAVNKLGESVPFWASLTRLFWMIVICLFGVILGIKNILRLKKLSIIETIETGGLLGILFFSSICVFTFPGGTQTQRILTYGPFFIVPIIVLFVTNFKFRNSIKNTFDRLVFISFEWVRTHDQKIIFCFFIILSLPTFLVNRPDINTMSIYKYELSAGEFVEFLYNGNDRTRFFTDIQTVYEYSYYIPDGKLNNPPQPYEIKDKEGVWNTFHTIISKFVSSKEPAIFILTERLDQAYRTITITEQSYSRLIELTNQLSNKNSIYNNGHICLYHNQPIQ
jgi:hypothetical protein